MSDEMRHALDVAKQLRDAGDNFAAEAVIQAAVAGSKRETMSESYQKSAVAAGSKKQASLMLTQDYWDSNPPKDRQGRLDRMVFEELRTHDADKFKEPGILINEMRRCPYTFFDEDKGTQFTQPRYILIDAQGQAYNIFGQGLVRCVDDLVRNEGKPPWEKPIRFVLAEKDVKSIQPMKVFVFRDA